MRSALCSLFFVALRSVGPILKSRPWRDGPQAIAILERSDHLEMAENRLEKYL